MKTAGQQLPPSANGVGGAPLSSSQRSSDPLGSPPATRAAGRTWKDPRLLVGIAIVAVCVLLGARLLAAADDTVAVWSVRADVSAGTALTVDDLERQDLRFGSALLAGQYVSANDEMPQGMVLTRDLTAGELLPRAALGAGDTREIVELPVAVASEAVPATLRVGEVVDVWVTPTAEAGVEPRAVRVLQHVRVVALPRNGSSLGPTSTRQVVVGLPAEEEQRLPEAFARLSDGAAVLVRRG